MFTNWTRSFLRGPRTGAPWCTWQTWAEPRRFFTRTRSHGETGRRGKLGGVETWGTCLFILKGEYFIELAGRTFLKNMCVRVFFDFEWGLMFIILDLVIFDHIRCCPGGFNNMVLYLFSLIFSKMVRGDMSWWADCFWVETTNWWVVVSIDFK